MSAIAAKYIWGESSGTVRLCRLATGEDLWAVRAHETQVWHGCFSPDGTRAITGSEDAAVVLWDVAPGRPVQPLSGHTRRISAVAIDAAGRRALTADENARIKLWDIHTGLLERTMVMPESHAFELTFTRQDEWRGIGKILHVVPPGAGARAVVKQALQDLVKQGVLQCLCRR